MLSHQGGLLKTCPVILAVEFAIPVHVSCVLPYVCWSRHKCRLRLKNPTTTIHWLILEYPWPLLYFCFRVFPTLARLRNNDFYGQWTICTVYVDAREIQACHNLNVAEVKFQNWHASNEAQHVQKPQTPKQSQFNKSVQTISKILREKQQSWVPHFDLYGKFCSASLEWRHGEVTLQGLTTRASKCAGMCAIECAGKPTCFKTATKTKYQRCPWHGGCNSRWDLQSTS